MINLYANKAFNFAKHLRKQRHSEALLDHLNPIITHAVRRTILMKMCMFDVIVSRFKMH